MPWTYGVEGVRIARDLFRLRYRLLPYIYTMARAVHDDALPLVRPLYLMNPDLEEAYRHPDEYFFGDAMLVAPVLDSTGVRDVYLPPGEWIDYFTGTRYAGDRNLQMKCSLETLPLFVRGGSIIPQQPEMAYTNQKPLDSLIVDVYDPGNSMFSLYEDDGISLDYAKGKSAFTPFACDTSEFSCRFTVGPTQGEYSDQPANRCYLINLTGVREPSSVRIDGMNIPPRSVGSDQWNWDILRRVLTLHVGRRSIRNAVRVDIRF
jgi:alpha-glucosidase (family GH31 glycosyl hydrolase)